MPDRTDTDRECGFRSGVRIVRCVCGHDMFDTTVVLDRPEYQSIRFSCDECSEQFSIRLRPQK